jgi:hypothetical protein
MRFGRVNGGGSFRFVSDVWLRQLTRPVFIFRFPWCGFAVTSFTWYQAAGAHLLDEFQDRDSIPYRYGHIASLYGQ